MDLMTRFVRILEIDRVHLEQREIPLALFGTPDLPLHRITSPQREAPYLRRRHINVVRPWQVIGVWGSEEAEAVLQYFNNPFADDLDLIVSKTFQNTEHELLLP